MAAVRPGGDRRGRDILAQRGQDLRPGLDHRMTLTFSAAVDVTGTPRLKIDMYPAHWGEKWASYDGDSGMASVTLPHQGGGAEFLHLGHRRAHEHAHTAT